MGKNKLNRSGFTYLAALMMVMVMGIMLGVVGQLWKTVMKREQEAELIFRGRQYKDAITSWYKPTGVNKGRQPTPLRKLDDLLSDPNSQTTVRYLRKLYTDPITGKDWKIITGKNMGILGVATTSEAKPLKTGGFPDDLADLSGKTRYSDWLFMYNASPTTGGTKPTGSSQ